MNNKQKPRLAGRGNGNEFRKTISKTQYITKRTPIYRNDGVVIGYVEGDTFIKNVKASIHQLRNPPGWASDIDVLDYLEELGISYIEITDTETGRKYRATIQDFWDNGIGLNRGCGEQIVLPLKYWDTDKQDKEIALSKPPKPSKSLQMALPF